MTNLTRRTLLAGSAAVAAASAFPMPALALGPSPLDILRANLDGMMMSPTTHDLASRALKNFVQNFDITHVMRSPLMMVGDQQVMARSRNARAQYNLEQALDGVALRGKAVEEEIAWAMGAEIAAELTREQNTIRQWNGGSLAPYQPILPYVAMDPNTFVPTVAFRMRYGIVVA